MDDLPSIRITMLLLITLNMILRDTLGVVNSTGVISSGTTLLVLVGTVRANSNLRWIVTAR